MLRLDGKIPLNLNSDFMIYPIWYVRYILIRGVGHTGIMMVLSALL